MFHRRQHPHPCVCPTAVLCLEISAVNLREDVECSLQSAEIEPERGVKAPTHQADVGSLASSEP